MKESVELEDRVDNGERDGGCKRETPRYGSLRGWINDEGIKLGWKFVYFCKGLGSRFNL